MTQKPQRPPTSKWRKLGDLSETVFEWRLLVSAAILLPGGIVALFAGNFGLAAGCLGLGAFLAWALYTRAGNDDSAENDND